MPKKTAAIDLTTPESIALLERYQKIGLNASRSKDVAQSAKSSAAFQRLAEENSLDSAGLDEKQAGLCVDLTKEAGYENATGKEKLSEAEVRFVVAPDVCVRMPVNRSARPPIAASQYLEATKGSRTVSGDDIGVNAEEFNKSCGVGVSFTPDSLLTTLESYMQSLSIGSDAPTDWSGLQGFRANMKTGVPDLRWANGKDLAVAVENLFGKLFGPKTAGAGANTAAKDKGVKKADTAKNNGNAKAAVENTASTTLTTDPTATPNPTSLFSEGFLSKLHKPGENPQIKPELKEKHLAWTKGRVFTRFPPSPTDICISAMLRPLPLTLVMPSITTVAAISAEEGVYFDSILEMVRWLGFEPWKITYTSDNFQKLFDFAMELTKRGKAFVCHCDQETMAAAKGSGKGNPQPCPHRDRPVEENIREFQAMKDGRYPEKGACLRMKIDLSSGNPYMWDPVCYRVKDAPHHRTGTTWKIYPAYDFAHPLCDSLENITHSLCTLEFIDARASYEWLCDALEVYKPRQYETARLQLQGTFLSKRKIRTLVEKGYVQGWDDPRLFTLIALRRRGIPPAAMLRFVEELGVSLSNSEIKLARFEHAIRQTLELSAARLFLVLEPVKLTITNVADDYSVELEKPIHPKVPEMGKVKCTLTKSVYIERDDFRVDPPADFNRLAPGKSVILIGSPYPVTCTDFKMDAEGKVTEIICALEDGTGPNGDKKFKGKDASAIHWVSAQPGRHVEVDEVRYFEPLFKSDDPSKVDNFETDINPDSLKVYKGALLEPAFYPVAKKLIKDAKAEADKRTKAAASFAQDRVETSKPAEVAQGAIGSAGASTKLPHDDDTPVATADQLVGMECIRFQGMRLAYFAVDKESVIGCLEEDDSKEAGPRAGDRIVLNKIVSLKEEKSKKLA
ncbi:hypothetical protein QFC19_001996 [Naganishia cerealis]|uniref:Uncharacterized protein n=1 Tax=Naganishia cerealis TaxID=610337 RepID=A0ACC2WFZ7_9TREE|nr:hypothetical protein QFC19_001996 [Naganishia cerealis]